MQIFHINNSQLSAGTVAPVTSDNLFNFGKGHRIAKLTGSVLVLHLLYRLDLGKYPVL